MAAKKKKPFKIFCIAGEVSGDQMAADVLAMIKKRYGTSVTIRGVGGTEMRKQGLKRSLFPMEELSVMGVFEILPILFSLLKRIRQTVDAIVQWKPDVVLSFDAPDFCFRVLKRVHASGMKNKPKLIHFVAPTVWAWREGRARKIAKFLNHIVCLFPFEPPYFEKEGLSASYLPHPLLKLYPEKLNGQKWRQSNKITNAQELIGILPGSRSGEIKRMLPVFLEAAQKLYDDNQSRKFALLTLKRFEKNVKAQLKQYTMPVELVFQTEDKPNVLAACDAAMATSGTIGFELALAQTPHLVAYRSNSITIWLLRQLVKARFIHLMNIHLDKKVIPELIQAEATAESIHQEMRQILEKKTIRNQQQKGFKALRSMLGPGERHKNLSFFDVMKKR